MDFEEYLISKKIDSAKFQKGDHLTFKEFQDHFNQMHPESFTASKLFMINNLRRKYLLEKSTSEEIPKKPTVARPKVMMRPKPKT